MIPSWFVYIGAAFSLAASLSYTLATLRGETQPNRVTWALWALFPLIAGVAEIKGGVGLPALNILVAGLGPCAIFLCSFVNPKAYWKSDARDYICCVLALVGLLLWYLTRNQDYAILLTLAADIFASIPTFRKSWTHPESENRWSYLLWTINSVASILCVQKPGFTGYAFPAYLVLENLSLFLIIAWKRKRAS